jgi:hypothetical protein
MSELYETDFLRWTEEQAEALRQARASAVNLPLDWDNLIEEVEDLGRSQLHAVISHLRLALLHDLKAEAWPLVRDAPHWRAEAVGHRQEAASRYTPSMRQRIDLTRIYRQALRAMPETVDGAPPLPVPTVCPVSLEELLAVDDA